MSVSLKELIPNKNRCLCRAYLSGVLSATLIFSFLVCLEKK